MPEETICPKHNVALKLRKNMKTGELALACPFCDAEKQQHKREDFNQAAARTVREATESSR
jgi:hypothetical protein